MPDIIAHFSEEVLHKLEVFVQQGIYTDVSYLVLKPWGFLLLRQTRSPCGLRRSYLHRLNIPTPRRYC